MRRSLFANRPTRLGLLERRGQRRDRTALWLPSAGVASGRLLPAPSGSQGMTTRRLAALVLIAAGTLGLLYGKPSATEDTHPARQGSIELAVRESETVDIPSWLGLAALATGGIFLFLPRDRG